MICRSCDSPDVSFVRIRRPYGSPDPLYWYRCNACRRAQTGPEPVCVSFDDEAIAPMSPAPCEEKES